jgi:epoxyqueuosine reductase
MKTIQKIWSDKIKQKAKAMGFSDCKIAPAGLLSEDAKHLKKWLLEGKHADMHYMENHFEKRIDPRKLMPETKSIILVLLNYFPRNKLAEENNFHISKYAYGRDYHKVMKTMLKSLQKAIHDEIVPHNARIFVDSAPVLERAWAERAGLGWIGKNANLISPVHGSFVFIGEILVDIDLAYDKPIKDFCGSCTKCIQACPTNAIIEPKTIDSRLCISYWTIENKGSIDSSMKGNFQDRIFGCDICQDVCPWNKKAKFHTVEEFEPDPELISMVKKDWEQLTEEKFNILFNSSAVNRTGYVGLQRNIRFVNNE